MTAALDILREPQPNSQIAQERVGPGAPAGGFVTTAVLVGAACAAVAAYVGLRPEGPFPVETALSGNPGSLYFPLGLHAARAVSALAAGVAVTAVAFAARRLFHSNGVGLLAAALVALDPGLLAMARLATPDTLALAATAVALACFLAVPPWAHWSGAGALVLAGLVEPHSLLWGVPIGLMSILRGHIYAAPRHIGTAAVQALLAPLAGLGLNALSGGPGLTTLACQPSIPATLGLAVAPLFETVAPVHDPIVWFGGMGALLLMAAAAGSSVIRQLRVARLPGRLQLRLAAGLPPLHGRIFWLLLLALFAPFGLVWLLVFAIALAAGIGELAEDAPGFGITVGLVVLGFALVALVRAWSAVHGMGDAGAAADGLVPWIRLEPCP